MKIAIDVSPIEDTSKLAHRVRGTGFYIKNLKDSLIANYPRNEYIFFNRAEEILQDVDLVHYPYFSPFFLSIPLFRQYKTVVTIHDLTPLVFSKHFPSGIKGKLKWFIQKKILESIDGIITDSYSSKKDILKFTKIQENKIHVVHLAASNHFQKIEKAEQKKKLKDAISKKYGLPDKFVLYVGDATWNKNIPRLLEAMIKINIPLVLTGQAIIQKEFDRNNPWNQDLILIQKIISDNKLIRAIGFVSDQDLVALYNCATVFTMPSLYEGFGLPVLEAMSCGCPVITTRCGSLPEIAGDAVEYVDPYNIDNISKKIVRVFEDNTLREKLIIKGFKQAKNFSWKKTSQDTINVYEKIV